MRVSPSVDGTVRGNNNAQLNKDSKNHTKKKNETRVKEGEREKRRICTLVGSRLAALVGLEFSDLDGSPPVTTCGLFRIHFVHASRHSYGSAVSKGS